MLKQKILLVDDDRGNLNALRLNFCNDFLVLLAENGAEAMNLLSKDENTDIAAIITDQKMEGMTGLELLKKAIEIRPSIIRVLITGFPDIEDTAEAINTVGVHRVFFKPLQENQWTELKDFIKDAIKKVRLEDDNKRLSKFFRDLLKGRNRIRRLFERYLPSEIIQLLERRHDRNPASMQEVEKKVVTILYADVHGFTALCEKLQPLGIVDLLNKYLEMMSGVIHKNGGKIDKFIGDKILATFGVVDVNSNDPAENAKNAVRCAAEMKMSLNQFNKEEEFPCIQFGVGINTGEILVGNIGPPYRWDYTVIGEAVNQAIRIEGMSKGRPGTILIGEETFMMSEELLSKFHKWPARKFPEMETYLEVYEVLEIK